jgi:ribosomal protein L40E
MAMSFGVDALGALTEKLRQLVNDTQEKYESFIDDSQLFKQGKINERDFFAKIGEYLIAFSALNFLAIRVILELRSAAEKGTSYSNTSTQAGFGIGGFVGTGGTVGMGPGSQEYVLPTPQQTDHQEPKLRPVNTEVKRPNESDAESTKDSKKNCIVCGSTIPSRAKYCSRCGNSQ